MADTLRSVPGLNVIQTSARDINLTARQATSTLATSQLVTRRRPLGLPRLLRARAVGPGAVADLRRDQADRGRARPGLGRVGRQRRERRRQHHHQDAARERGLRARAGRRALQPRRRLARGGRERLPVQRRVLVRERDQRHLVLPAERRLLQLRPVLAPGGHGAARLPPARRSCRAVPRAAPRSPGGVPIGGATFPPDANQPGAFENKGTSQPKFSLRFDQDFKNGGRITVRGRLRRHRRASSTRASGRSGSRAGRTWRTAAWPTARARCVSAPSATSSTPRRPTCSCPDPDTLGPDHPGLQDPDLRLRDREHERAGREPHPHLRRQRAAEQLRHLARAGRRTAPSTAPTCSGSSSSDKFRFAAGGARRQVRQPRRPGLLAARERDVQAHARPTRSAPSYNRRSSRRRSSTTT